MIGAVQTDTVAQTLLPQDLDILNYNYKQEQFDSIAPLCRTPAEKPTLASYSYKNVEGRKEQCFEGFIPGSATF